MAAAVSRSGVFYDLSASPWVFERNGIVFWFSTARLHGRFVSLVAEAERKLCASMSARVGCRIDMSAAADVQLYIRTETRGFRVSIDGEVATCPDQVVFDGPRPSVSA